MNHVITLNHHMSGYTDVMETIALYYGIHYQLTETENGCNMLFKIKEDIDDTRTLDYFRDMLCYIFDTEPSYDYYALSYAAEVSIYSIIIAFVDCIRRKYDYKHYTEHIKEFNKNRNVDMNGCLPIIHMLKNGKLMLPPVESYQVGYDIRERLSYESLEGGTKEQATVRKKNRRAVYRNFNFDNLYESCHLYRNFCDGDEFYDVEQLFIIARSLCGAEKGKKQFLDIMAERNDNTSYHWEAILIAIIKGNIPIASCEECAYCEHCKHGENMLATAKPHKFEVRETKQEKYVSINEVSNELNNAFERAVNAQDNKVYIIKAQTGIGKTHTYINYMKDTESPLLIAVPTHELKKEIYRKAIAMGINNICCTPDIDEYAFSDELRNEINNLYTVGAGEYVLDYLRNKLKELKNTDYDHTIISEYLTALKNTTRSKGHIITTHARLLHMNQEALNNHEIIIDEDILKSAITCDSVSMHEIKAILKSGLLNSAIQSKLNCLCMKRGYHILDKLYFDKDAEIMRKISSCNSNICGLMNAEYFYITPKMIHYLTDNHLPDRKLIILSATASPELYQKFYPDRCFDYYECHKAQYKGKIIQHTDCSYSGYVLEKNPDKINTLFRLTREDTVITFKSIEHEFNTQYHFGNVEGLNLMSGKDLTVIGLPNKPDFVYCLYGMRAGLTLEKTPSMYHQRVDYGNYNFSLNTFKESILQKIQMWILSSQLEQAVGRARLLRNNSTVTVYAGFPVEQAVFSEK